MSTLCHCCGFAGQQRMLKAFTGSDYLFFKEWGSLAIPFTGKLVYMAHHLLLLRLNPFRLRVDMEGWWFEHSVS